LKRFVLALCLTLANIALTGSLITPAFAQEPAQAPAAGANVTGDWRVQATGSQFILGNMHLAHVGDTLVGSAIAPSGKGVMQIHGTFAGSKVSGKWRGPTGEVGWITLNFQGNSTFNGEWGYGGRPPSGNIVAHKIRATAF
jgi:hypothetical protein